MPRFDYKRAKAEGYTDEEINQYLRSKRAQGVDVWIDKADYQAATAPSKPLDPFQYFNLPVASPFSVRADRSVDNFPVMGALVGNAAIGVPGAALYGAAGETMRRSLRGLPLDPKAIYEEGKAQALQALAGHGLAMGAGVASATIGPAARWVSRVAGSPIGKKILDTGRIGLPVGGMAKGGLTGMAAGLAAPIAGRAALGVAMSPRTAAFLGSEGFRALLRTSPQAALNAYRQHLAQEADATQTR